MPNVISAANLQSRDLLIGELVKLELETSGYPVLGDLTVTAINERNVRIEGCVRSYYMKQMAQTIAIQVPGVEHIENDVEVIES